MIFVVGPCRREGGLTADGEDLRSRGLWYGWDQNSLSILPSLDAVSLDGSRQRLATGKKVHPQLVGAQTRLGVHMLVILNHATGEHRPNRDSVTPIYLVRAIKLFYLMPALLYSPSGRIKRRQWLELVKSGDRNLLLP